MLYFTLYQYAASAMFAVSNFVLVVVYHENRPHRVKDASFLRFGLLSPAIVVDFNDRILNYFLYQRGHLGQQSTRHLQDGAASPRTATSQQRVVMMPSPMDRSSPTRT